MLTLLADSAIMQLCPATLVASGAWPNLLWRIDMDSLPEVNETVNSEIWKTWPRFPQYEASNLGKVRHKTRGIVRKPTCDKDGYGRVSVSDRGTMRAYFLHAIILETFVGSRPHGMECRHLDGNHLNNRLENLAWGTHADNAHDSAVHGKHKGERHPKHVLTCEKVHEIRTSLKTGVELSRMYGVSEGVISRIRLLKAWKHITSEVI